MSSIDKMCQRMSYWCSDEANLGYDQGNRWDIRVGGECDCSSLVLWCAYEAGYIDKPTWGNTATMCSQLCPAGFTQVPNDGNPQYGDILLNEGCHTALYLGDGLIGQASIDENGNIMGGASGDQVDETNIRGYYNYPWDLYLRPPAEARKESVEVAAPNVQLWELRWNDNQRWFIDQKGKKTAEGWPIVALKNEASGKWLDRSGGATDDCTNVGVYRGNGSKAQLWAMEECRIDDVQLWKFHAITDTKQVLDGCRPYIRQNGDNVQVYHNTNNTNQCWTRLPAGDGRWYLLNGESGLALDVVNGGMS